MKLATTVILYHPPESVLENIATYYEEIERLYVFDNTEQSFCRSWFTNLEKVVFLHDGENKGIARRLNEGCNLAWKEGYDRMLTMDQDSRFPLGTFATYLRCIQQQHTTLVAAFGLAFGPEEQSPLADCQPEATPFIITSGMLLSLSITAVLNGFDEALFIDSVDHEYCLRANINGYETIRFNHLFLHHTVGVVQKRTSLKTLYLVKKYKQIHSPLRCYYMYRNALYLNRKYKKTAPQAMVLFNKIVKGNLNRNLWYGHSIRQFLHYIFKARSDFSKGQMGKIREE